MEREAVKVLSGAEYDHLFPRALLTTIVQKTDATVADTINLIPQIVRETTWQATKLAKYLKAETLEQTCRNIWEFVYNHIAYKKDENGKEQVRSFARTWHDRHNFQKDKNGNFLRDRYGGKVPGGVDCDCGTTFISTLLSALQIKHALRIVKFWTPSYSHIYPIVPLPGGGHITIDFVVHRFNYEEPYSEKDDTKMDLEYLNGVYSSDLRNAEAITMADSYEDKEVFGELGKLFNKKISIPKVQLPKIQVKDVFKPGGIKEVAAKLKNVTNILNPAVVPLRLGLLAAMKVNFMKIGSRIKYAYLTDAEAQKRGVDMAKFARLKKIKDKLENIFFQAGGQQGAIKEAVLKGAGNKNNDVLAGLDYSAENLMGISERTPLSRLLGQTYYDEVSGFEGLGALGEPVTAAVITAATGALTAIALLLKQVGNIFPPKSKGAQDFEEGTNTSGETNPDTKTQDTREYTDPGTNTEPGNNSTGTDQSHSSGTENGGDQNNLPATNPANGGDQKQATTPSGNETFWQKNHTWLLPSSIGLAVLITIGGVVAFKKTKKGNSPVTNQVFHGLPQSRKKKKKGGAKPKIQSKKKDIVKFI